MRHIVIQLCHRIDFISAKKCNQTKMEFNQNFFVLLILNVFLLKLSNGNENLINNTKPVKQKTSDYIYYQSSCGNINGYNECGESSGTNMYCKLVNATHLGAVGFTTTHRCECNLKYVWDFNENKCLKECKNADDCNNFYYNRHCNSIIRSSNTLLHYYFEI